VAVSDDPEFVLSLRAAGLGDLLTAVPALRAIRRANASARHVLATTPRLYDVAHLIGAVDVVVPAVVGVPCPPLLHGVDLAVNLHGCGPESHRTLLDCRPRRLVAFSCGELAVDGPKWDPKEHEVRRWCRLVTDAGMPADPDDLDVHVPPGRVPPRVRGATVLHPGAAAPSRRWPIERWVALAAAEVADGHRVAVTIGPGEAAFGAAIVSAVPQATVVDCSVDATLLFRIIDAARVLVCADTGVAHVATAVRTPSVVLFGPVSPARWGPPCDRPWHVPLWAGRSGDPHGLRTDPGLLALEVVDVLLAVRRLRASFGALPGSPGVTSCAS
jgi:ADP-heptose:LPS heptosyltransferase